MDSQVKHILSQEVKRQNTTIELIASENFASDDVMRLCGSVFTNKYAEGYPSKRYYNGCDYMDLIEEVAIEELKKYTIVINTQMFNHIGAIKVQRLQKRLQRNISQTRRYYSWNGFIIWWSFKSWFKTKYIW